ncbi:glycosyl hydrolase [Demequina zhanjiangensis]|uniref:glucan endo-1,3-beta-D-glucosidase n=1 Tax=Demequina zhanjiangensis TaxID=3051659 RepID=A0ABT8FY99_9MICO|nr:glycosyl hydrolase [Demequina sp. SYSU T00b26]MDN4471424.1 glycosyl hydrolase [Demequina sp. SYSU T00b26]
MTRAQPLRLLTAAGLASALVVLAGCTGDAEPDGSPMAETMAPTADGEVGVVDAAASTLAQTLPVEAIAEPPSMEGVADGVLAPTNRWYSGLVYADLPAKSFATPVAVQVDAGSLGVALPTIAASDALIAAQTADFLTVTVEGADSRPKALVNEPAYTTLAFSDPGAEDDARLATATVAQGWPAIGFVATADVTLSLSAAPTWGEDGVGIVDLAGTTYAVSTADAEVDGADVTLRDGGWLQAFPVPAGADPSEYAALMSSPVVAVTPQWAVGEDNTSTTLTYETLDGGPTVVVPSAAVDGTVTEGTCDAGTFATIDGPTVACVGNDLTWHVDTIRPELTLDVSNLSAEEQEAVTAALADADVADYPSDTYFGSKALYRDAQAYAIADALGDEDSAARIGQRLSAALTQWTQADGCELRSSRCFVYDENWGGVVGLEPSFDSQEFNDHHFHYGYLIYAAAIAVETGLLEEDDVAPVVDALVADIASTGTDQVPALRPFDPWAGHSWASGISPFADGNNQESSSEAVLAWTAVAAWAELRGDAGAAERATWMLSAEAHSAIALYVRPDTSFAPEYLHQVVGIQWGGKRDWATWFSPDPAAMLGIQLIPLAPTQAEILAPTDETETSRVLSSITEAMPTGTADQFTDLITMYSALAGPKQQSAAWSIALALPDSAIDDGMTRAYMLAFIAAAG